MLRSTQEFPALIYRVRPGRPARFDLVNDAIEDFVGYRPTDLYQDPNLVSRLVHASDLPLWYAMFEPGVHPTAGPTRIRLIHRDGHVLWTEHRLCALYTEEEAPVAIEGIAIDVSSQHEIESALRKNTARLIEAQRIARIGNWEWDIVTNHLWWSDQIYELFGIQPHAFGASYEAFLSMVHHDDREKVMSAVTRAMDIGESYSIDHRIVLPDGTLRVVHEEAEVSFDQDGAPIRMVGTVHDITEWHLARQQLTLSETRMRAILEAMPDMIFRLNRQGIFLDFSGPRDALLFEPQEFLGRRIDDLFPPDHVKQTMACTDAAIETGESQTHEYDLSIDGSTRSFEARYVKAGEDEVVVVIRDVTDRKTAEREIEELKERLLQENILLRREVCTTFESELIGGSSSLDACKKSAEIVAPTTIPVLLLGETGTGKELFAKRIHRLSHRRDQPMVCVNCPAIPEGLIESELFGHERGAFTGAIGQRLGRFEVANGGTLFLDEIGDLPLELQAKLLRVVQEGQFERVGGSKTIRADVRLIAATNRDLERAVRNGEFRADLYYRISNFPIRLPPLRERKNDIPPLVEHFVRKHEASLNRKITDIAPDFVHYLEQQFWPGNVRELEGFVVRAMIASRGRTLSLGAAKTEKPTALHYHDSRRGRQAVTLEDAERLHILSTLQASDWLINGRKGAAQILDLPPSTLRSKMKRLGIERPER